MSSDGTDGDGTPESIKACNREEVPSLLARYRERLTEAWAARLPMCPMTLWLAFDGDGPVTGAGTTATSAWASALDAEVLAMTDDDSHRHAASIDALEAELMARAGGYHLAHVSLAGSFESAEAFCKAVGVTPESPVHGLIKSAVEAAVGMA